MSSEIIVMVESAKNEIIGVKMGTAIIRMICIRVITTLAMIPSGLRSPDK